MATSEPKVNETLPTNLVKTKTTKTTEKSTMLNLQQEKKGTQMIRSPMVNRQLFSNFHNIDLHR